MKSILFAVFLFASSFIQAQYYYKDIIGTQETNDLIKRYLLNKVQSVAIKSFEADGSASEGFFVQQSVIAASNLLRTTTRSGVTDESVLTSTYDNQGRIIKTHDSTGGMSNTTLYTYSADDRLASVTSTSTDSSQSINEMEQHNWFYNAAGRPVKMERIINKGQPVEIKFVFDEKGNIAEEQTIKKSVVTDAVYYYYDDNNRMTDIVRYNAKAKRLLPDYMFEYSDAGQVIQKITVPANGSDYLIWRYQYDAKGLKIREALFNKQKQLTGKIEYSYSFQ